MEKRHIKKVMGLLIALLIVTAGAIIFTVFNIAFGSSLDDEENLPYNYSYTKAICTDSNLCQDNVIYCKNKQVVEMVPLVESTTQFSQNWQDPRSQYEIDRLCD